MEESNAGDEESEFMNINDDCIREILKHLNGADLHSIAGVCSRLRELAIEIFAKKPNEKTVTVLYDRKEWKKIANYLRIFGPHIETVRLIPYQNEYFSDFPVHKHRFACILRLLLRYSCETLKTLQMNWFDATQCTSVTADDMRPLFSGLSKLILNNCVLPIEWIAMCNSITELNLFRTDMHNEFAQPLRLENLRELKIETHSYYAAKHFPVVRYLNHPESIEHFDIDSVRLVKSNEIDETFFQSLHTFKNMKTLRLYRRALYIAEGETHDVFRRLTHLTELVWGYTPMFSVQQLMSLIDIGKNLERMVVIYSSEVEFRDHRRDNFIDPNLYRIMLDKVAQRPNQKALSVIIVGNENQISRFRVTIPMHPSFTITCLVQKELMKTLNFDTKHDALARVKISIKETKVLQEKGLIP